MRLSASLLLGVLALAACGGDGGGPPIDRAVATRLARAADAVAAAADPCTAHDRAVVLQTRTIAAINAGRIPDAYLEPLLGRVNEIVGELQVRCLPQPAPRSTRPVAVVPQPGQHPQRRERDRHERGHGHGRKGDR